MTTLQLTPRPGGLVSTIAPMWDDPYATEPSYDRYLPSDRLKGLPSVAGVRPNFKSKRMLGAVEPIPPGLVRKAVPWKAGYSDELPPSVWKGGLSEGRFLAAKGRGKPVMTKQAWDRIVVTNHRGPKTMEDLSFDGMGLFGIPGIVSGIASVAAPAVSAAASSPWLELARLGIETAGGVLAARAGRGRRGSTSSGTGGILASPSILPGTAASALTMPRWLEDIIGTRRRETSALPMIGIALLALMLLGGKKRRR